MSPESMKSAAHELRATANLHIGEPVGERCLALAAELEVFAERVANAIPQEKVIRQGSAIGVIEFTRSERKAGEPQCMCCPGETGHVFHRGVKFGPFHDVYPQHFGHGVRELLGSVALENNAFEGKRVRVTVEVLED